MQQIVFEEPYQFIPPVRKKYWSDILQHIIQPVLRRKYGVVSAGLLRMDDRGTGYAVLESSQSIDHYETIGVSLEPAGGSPQPTGPRVMNGSL